MTIKHREKHQFVIFTFYSYMIIEITMTKQVMAFCSTVFHHFNTFVDTSHLFGAIIVSATVIQENQLLKMNVKETLMPGCLCVCFKTFAKTVKCFWHLAIRRLACV